MLRVMVNVIALLFLLLPLHSYAEELGWQVVKATMQVNYTVGNDGWLPVKAGMVLPNGAWISTGPRGRAVLGRNGESITFHPQTLVSIITTSEKGRKTSVLQQQGMLDLDIEKRATPHTYVQTPYLVAIVKGTKFTVSISDKSAKVSVKRGLVGVRSYTSGQQADVGAGQSASVDNKQGMTTGGLVSSPSIKSTTKSISPLNAASLSASPTQSTSPTSESSTGSSSVGHESSSSQGGSRDGSEDRGDHSHTNGSKGGSSAAVTSGGTGGESADGEGIGQGNNGGAISKGGDSSSSSNGNNRDNGNPGGVKSKNGAGGDSNSANANSSGHGRNNENMGGANGNGGAVAGGEKGNSGVGGGNDSSESSGAGHGDKSGRGNGGKGDGGGKSGDSSGGKGREGGEGKK